MIDKEDPLAGCDVTAFKRGKRPYYTRIREKDGIKDFIVTILGPSHLAIYEDEKRLF